MKFFLTCRILVTLGKNKQVDHYVNKFMQKKVTNRDDETQFYKEYVESKEDVIKEDLLNLLSSVHFFYQDKSYHYLKKQVETDLKKLQTDLKDLKQICKSF